MAANSVVRARIDERIKNEAAAVLSAMGAHGVGRLPHDASQDREGEGVAVRAAGSQ